MPKLCDFENCTGCAACIAVCNDKAISFDFNEVGERKPKIDEQRCINCLRCEKVCPVFNPINTFEKEDFKKPSLYMCYDKSSKIREKSASGGLFRTIANHIIKKGGVVFGAKYNEEFNAHICKAETEDEVLPMCGSKYVESFTGDSYIQVKQALMADRLVYYSALPCQIAGLKCFLAKDYENLITSDIVCHGTCSNEYFQAYLDYLREKYKSEIFSFTHTSKIFAWTPLISKTISFKTKNGVKNIIVDHDSFLRLYMEGFFLKPICYACPFAKLPRDSDITLADFFGFGVLKSQKKIQIPKNGISMLMVNTQKGKNIFDVICGDIEYSERSIEESAYFNHNLWRPSKKIVSYQSFKADFARYKNWKLMEKKYFFAFGIRLKRNIRMLIKKILGPKLTAYCMYLVYKKTGLTKKVDSLVSQFKEN